MQKSLIEMAVGGPAGRAARSRPGTRRRRKWLPRKNQKESKAVNDFVVKFANVNGSGSASANELFARTFCAWACRVAEEHLPSNIQGLADLVRSARHREGHSRPAGGVDLMVAMNPQTWAQDLKEIEPGATFLRQHQAPPPSKFRDDIQRRRHAAHEICNGAYSDPLRAPALQRTSFTSARSAALMTSSPAPSPS